MKRKKKKRMKKKKNEIKDGKNLLNILLKFFKRIPISLSFAMVVKNLRCTTSYFPAKCLGSGLKISSFCKVVLGPYQSCGGYCASEISKPSKCVEGGSSASSRDSSPTHILYLVSHSMLLKKTRQKIENGME